MGETTYTLEELSARTGIDPRVIRSFIEQGLLLGPQSLGRYAKYSLSHLNRLLAIKVLKEKRGMKLSDIRHQLNYMTDAEIVALAEIAVTPSQADYGQKKGNALDYIRSLDRGAFGATPSTESRMNQSSSSLSNTSQKQSRLNLQQQSQQQSRGIRKQIKSDTWQRYTITPDVELNVRGVSSEHQQARLDNIVEQLRQLFLGGFEEDE